MTPALTMWNGNVNSAWGSSGVLRTATSFVRDTTYASVDELPDNAVKIDDGTTASSIYFWVDGTDCYWWSDAETVYMCPDIERMFYKCSLLTDLDLSDFDTSKVTNMNSMFADCVNLQTLNVADFDT